MRIRYWTYDGEKAIACEGMEEWVLQCDRNVKRDDFGELGIVSTVVVAVTLSPYDQPFETMVMGGEHDKLTIKSHTKEEALQAHQEACEMVNRTQIERNNKLNELGI